MQGEFTWFNVQVLTLVLLETIEAKAIKPGKQTTRTLSFEESETFFNLLQF